MCLPCPLQSKTGSQRSKEFREENTGKNHRGDHGRIFTESRIAGNQEDKTNGNSCLGNQPETKITQNSLRGLCNTGSQGNTAYLAADSCQKIDRPENSSRTQSPDIQMSTCQSKKKNIDRRLKFI